MQCDWISRLEEVLFLYIYFMSSIEFNLATKATQISQYDSFISFVVSLLRM